MLPQLGRASKLIGIGAVSTAIVKNIPNFIQEKVAETSKNAGASLVQGVVAGLKGVSVSDAAQIGAKVGVGALAAYGVYKVGVAAKNKVSNYLYGQ